MRKVTPSESFTGYPDGVKTIFSKGVEVEVSVTYAALLKRKGLLRPQKKRENQTDED